MQFWENNGYNTNLLWKLIPVKIEGTRPAPPQPLPETPGPGPLPPYDENATEQPLTRAQWVETDRDEFGTVETERDEFGTVVTEITTTTTRKRYRVQDA